MTVLFRWVTAAALGLALVAGTTAEAQQTGALTGLVRDAQGGVLPGVTVTVTGGALAGASRSTVSTEQGLYSLTGLPPGSYTRGVRTHRVHDAEARRGGRAGEPHHPPRRRAGGRRRCRRRSPSAASRRSSTSSSTMTQTNITKDLYEAIPTGRNPWVMAGLVPGRGHRSARRRRHRGHAAVQPRGVRLGRQPEVVLDRRPQDQLGRRRRRRDDAVLRLRDVRGIQHADGVGHRGERCHRRLHEHGHQVGRQPLHQRPQLLLHERRAAGRERRRRPAARGSGCGRSAARPAPPATRSTSPTTGARRWAARSSATRLWFFGALRWWRLDQFQIGARNADGSQAIDDNRIRNFMGKATWQAAPTPAPRSCSTATSRTASTAAIRRTSSSRTRRPCCRTSRRRTSSPRSTRWSASAACSTRDSAACGAMFPSRYQERSADRHRHPRRACVSRASTPPRSSRSTPTTATRPTPRSATSSPTSAGTPRLQGRPAAVVGADGLRPHPQRRHPARDCATASPFQGADRQHADRLGSPLETWGAFLQDRWMLGRATINVGVRLDGVERLPAGAGEPGRHLRRRARSFPETDVFDYSLNIMPRLGISYDLFGNGKTALKAYYGRFYNQFGSEIVESANPNALATQNVAWTDSNGDLRLDAGELGRGPGLRARPVPGHRPGRRSALQRRDQRRHRAPARATTSPSGVSYHRRQHRNGLGVVDRARPADRLHARGPHLHRSRRRRSRRSPSTSCSRRSARSATA